MEDEEYEKAALVVHCCAVIPSLEGAIVAVSFSVSRQTHEPTTGRFKISKPVLKADYLHHGARSSLAGWVYLRLVRGVRC